MTKTPDLWERIKSRISTESLLRDDELKKIESKILANRVTEEDWGTAIFNTHCKELNDEQQQ